MKMKDEHYKVLRDAIEHTFERMRSAEAPHMLAAQSYHDPELNAERKRWDILYDTKIPGYRTVSQWICTELYPYLNDDHIDTALRRIVDKGA